MASAAGNARDFKPILAKLEENLTTVIEQLSDDIPSPENSSFNKDDFWKNFGATTKLVSHEATKFCMMFNQEPVPSNEECQSLADKVEHTCMSFVTVFFTLPKTKGKFLHKEIRIFVTCVLQAMKELCVAAKNQSSNQLQTVGNVWEKCEAVGNLPRDNRDAVLSLCREEHEMVEDACQELMNAIEFENEELDFDISFISPRNGIRIQPTRAWTDSDRNVILPCSGLVKAVKACLKKIVHAISERGDGDHERTVNELDAVADLVKSSSALIDDFVLSLYPPVNHSVVRHQANLIRSTFKDILATIGVCHFCSEADTTWIDFLEKAIEHNWVKINDMVLAD